MGVEYSGSGKSLDDPIRIKGAHDKLAFVQAELSYIESTLGTRGVHWHLRFRAEHRQNKSLIDELGISADCGHMVSLFFLVEEEKKDPSSLAD
jgi:hypothetical protein